jgi:hypothetical protein
MPCCGIIESMMSLNLAHAESLPRGRHGALLDDSVDEASYPALRALGLASLVLAATALGLYIGRELRLRYKFNRRTPYDFYSNAGDPVAVTEYGMGV